MAAARLVRRLTAREVARYDVLPPKVAANVVLIRVPVIPGGYTGMTLGPVVLLAKPINVDLDDTLVAHELVHVRQYHEQGILGFAWKYNRAYVHNLFRLRSLRQAYLQIPAEQEARRLARDWDRRQQRKTESNRPAP